MLIVPVILQARPIAEFRKWVVEHGKAYLHDEAEFARRFDIWRDNLDYIHEYNTQGHTHWVRLARLVSRALDQPLLHHAS